jgi:hypothetical protein
MNDERANESDVDDENFLNGFGECCLCLLGKLPTGKDDIGLESIKQLLQRRPAAG